MKSDQTKVKKTLNIVIRVLIITLTWGYISWQVAWGREYNNLIANLYALTDESGMFLKLLLILFLMLVNWGIESRKWQFMIRKIEKVSFRKSVQAVLTGVSVSSFTPNRIGEYFGRAYVLDKASHMEGILITILGSMSQLLITILCGTISVILLMPGYFLDSAGTVGYIYAVPILMILLLDGLLLLIYLNVPILTSLREKILTGRRMEKIRNFFAVFSKFNRRDLFKVLMLSLTRYLVFTTQYYLLLTVFSIDIPFETAILFISVIFLLISVIPTVFLTELGIRDSIALFLFGLFYSRSGLMTDNIRMGILMASTILWIVNLALPALIGTLFVVRLKFFRKNILVETRT